MAEQITYKEAGVDIHAGTEAISRIKKHVSRTFNKNANIIDSRTTIESLNVDLILQQIAKTKIDKSEMPI